MHPDLQYEVRYHEVKTQTKHVHWNSYNGNHGLYFRPQTNQIIKARETRHKLGFGWVLSKSLTPGYSSCPITADILAFNYTFARASWLPFFGTTVMCVSSEIDSMCPQDASQHMTIRCRIRSSELSVHEWGLSLDVSVTVYSAPYLHVPGSSDLLVILA